MAGIASLDTSGGVYRWANWKKITLNVNGSATEEALPTIDGLQHRGYWVWNPGPETVFIKIGGTGVIAQDETASTGNGVVLPGGVFAQFGTRDGDAYLIGSAAAAQIIYFGGME